MDMEPQGLPDWVQPIATIFVTLSVLTALAVAFDIYGRGYRHRAASVEGVWIISALWLGPFALPLYARAGRSRTAKWQAEHARDQHLGLASETASGSLPGAAASTISHVLAVPFVLATGLSLFGVPMYAMIVIILVLAIAMLFAFEYSTTHRRTVGGMSVATALAVATVTVLAFDIGMVGWMLVLHFTELLPPPGSVNFLFLMQIGNLLGFLAALPVVAFLLTRGVKPVGARDQMTAA
jgi:hypothetical protein